MEGESAPDSAIFERDRGKVCGGSEDLGTFPARLMKAFVPYCSQCTR